ncbi:leucine-rich repeat-containing protein 70-like [Manduca sexta]|uniref:LRRCT domain-containing protein n=1 Tax=Manduca sexta TaxID=7130 RepID=A0A922CJG7_MANSE|nr:leucine-rich repeat-containing protein 70-like [Manduca sexta]KAG6447873.1 hypothetical protein O3G_MSEX005201 [Manduca sexta]
MHIIIIFYLIYKVDTLSVCDSVCVCKYNNQISDDYQGETVDCSYNVGIFDNNVSLPNKVHSLDLSFSNLSRIDSTAVLRSKTMRELILNNNAITDIAPDSFSLPELRKIDLSYNSLEFIDKETFKNLKKLQYLNLANNKFTTFEKLTFHYLSNLNEIILDGNRIGPSLEEVNLFDRSGFGLTQKVQTISISRVGLNIVPDNFFVDAYDLRKLVISGNKITDIFEIPFTLEYLDLSDNPIQEISSEDFADLPALRVLKLNNVSIREVPEYVFEPLHALRTLELERNKNLTIFDKLAFGRDVLQDPNDFLLERLSIKGSRIKKLDKDLLDPLGQLIQLDLQGNPWICDCDLVWLKELQITEQYYEHLRCFTPKPLYNARIFDLDAKYFTCGAKKRHVGGILAIVSFCLILATLAIWIFLFLPKYISRGNVIQQMYTPSTAYSILPMSATVHDYRN